MSTQRLVLTGLLIIALLAPGAATSMAEPAGEANSASSAPENDDFPPPDWTYGPASGTVTGAGDLNGDGFDDVLVVDPQNAPWTRAVARVFYGSANGLAAEPGWVLTGYWQTCPAGDVNGDGYDDLFAASVEGLRVFFGSPDDSLIPGEPWSGPSISLGAAGDVNGDGYADLLAGDPFFTEGQEYEGSVSLYFGSPTGPSPEPGWMIRSEVSGLRMGDRVFAVGDLNGDGYGDIAYSSNPVSPYIGYQGGVLAIRLGSPAGPATTSAWRLSNYVVGDAIAAAADVDGDGYDDLLVGLPSYNCDPYSNCAGSGQLRLYRGSPTGPGTSPDWWLQGEVNGEMLGSSVATTGDLNGDGYEDVAAIDGGAVLALYGSSRGLATVPNWVGPAGGGRLDSPLASGTDVNGDGYDDLLAGYSAYHGSAAGPRGSRVLAQLVSQPFAIDGDLGDWPVLAAFTLDRSSAATLAGEPAEPDDAAASLRAAWDAHQPLPGHPRGRRCGGQRQPGRLERRRDRAGLLCAPRRQPGRRRHAPVHRQRRRPRQRLRRSDRAHPGRGRSRGRARRLERGAAHPGDAPVRLLPGAGPRHVADLQPGPARRRRRRRLGQLPWSGAATAPPGGEGFGQIVLVAIGGPLEEPAATGAEPQPEKPSVPPVQPANSLEMSDASDKPDAAKRTIGRAAKPHARLDQARGDGSHTRGRRQRRRLRRRDRHNVGTTAPGPSFSWAAPMAWRRSGAGRVPAPAMRSATSTAMASTMWRQRARSRCRSLLWTSQRTALPVRLGQSHVNSGLRHARRGSWRRQWRRLRRPADRRSLFTNPEPYEGRIMIFFGSASGSRADRRSG